MRGLGLAIAAGALLVTTQANAGSFPVNTLNAVGSDLVDQVAVRVFVHDGHRYCFYFDGWHGPGWYRCGFAFRRGLGWGGVYGWNSWTYGPYERRFGGRHHGDRIGVGVDSRTRSRTSVDTGTRNRTGVQTRSGSARTGVETRSGATRTGGEIRSRSTTTGSGVQGGARVRGSTTGSAPKADVPSEGGAKGAAGEGSRGGGSMGGGSMGEGAGKRQ